MEDRWLSVEEIATYLGVSKDAVYGWITSKGMPARRVGRLWKFKKEAVDQWIESGGAEADGFAQTQSNSKRGGRGRKKR